MEPNQPPVPPESSAPEPAAEPAPISEAPPPAVSPEGPPAASGAQAAGSAPPAERGAPAPRGPAERGAGPAQAGGGRDRGDRGDGRDRDRRGPKPPPRPGGQGRPGGGPPREGRGPNRPPQQHQPWSKPDFFARAVESGIDRAFIESALEFARSLGPGLTSSQVRGIYGEVLRQEIGGLDTARLLLLKPRLAYLAARAGRSEMRELRTVIERGVEKVCAEGIPDEERQARFERFARCLEAILAYHKTHERKQGERA